MDKIIEAYYSQAPINAFLLKQKMARFSRNPDIKKEFAYWIENKTFIKDAVVVEGYTAENLAAMSEYLVGESAFLLLIELRENPKSAIKQINKGFHML